METMTLTVDAEHAEVLRRWAAYKCGTAAEKLHGVADDYSFETDENSLSALRAATEEIQAWTGLFESIGWDEAEGHRELVAPQERLQDLLVSALAIAVERLDEINPRRVDMHEQRPSEVVLRRVEEMQLFEGLLDRVGWPDPDDEGGE